MIMKVCDINGNVVAEGYLVPNPNFIPKGEYKETELDYQKKRADMLITSIDTRVRDKLCSKERELV